MKKLLINISVLFFLLFFSACSSKEFQTKNYFDSFTKDEILEAGKLVFLMNKNDEYIIDSYRDRLEATKIGIVYGTLTHKDVLLEVEENECGTDATLIISANFGMKKILNHNVFEQEHRLFWDKMRFFLSLKEEIIEQNRRYTNKPDQYRAFSLNLNEIEVRKIEKTNNEKKDCKIKNEFEKGLIKSTSSLGEIENEAL